jgi:hypothetical protein
LKDRLPTGTLGFPRGSGLAPVRAALALACAVGLVAAAAAQRRLYAGGVLLVAVLALAASDGRVSVDWARANILDARAISDWVRTGVLIREHTAPSTAVAVVGAGSTPYFDHRPSVDLLGKMDPVVARGRPHPGNFLPGHDKWDYAHSIGALRPGVLAQVWSPSPADLCRIARWGYVQRAPQFFVRSGARNVDVAGLSASERAVDAFPAFAAPRGC